MFCPCVEADVMRYKTVKQNQSQRFSPELPHGIDLETNPSDADGSRLSLGKNVWFDSGRIATRPAVVGDPNSVIEVESYENIIKGLTVTDSTVTYGGAVYRIAYVKAADYDSLEDFYVYLMSFSGELTPIGSIRIGRVDSTTFNRAVSIMFFQGKSATGSGIYAFLRRRDTSDLYEVYELDSALEKWEEVTDFYAPTIYINGRGTRYKEASSAGWGYSAKPESPEAINMLSGGFKAFFSTDGYSSSFKLPLSNLENDVVTCRMYTAPDKYVEWKILPDKVSVQAEYNSGNITMGCDRLHGLLYFWNDDAPFSLPFISDYGPNNLVITATKKNGARLGKVIGCSSCRMYGSRLVVYGNPDSPSEICVSRLENPLYFPETACVSVGDVSDRVTAVRDMGDDLLIFKNKAVYKLNIKDGGYYTEDVPVSEENADFGGLLVSDKFSSTPVCLSVGCDCPNTLCNVSGNLLWQNKNGTVYAMESAARMPIDVSHTVRSAMAETFPEDSFAVGHRGMYFLFTADKKVFVFDLRKRNTDSMLSDVSQGAWYIWEMPDELIVSSAAADGDRLIICCTESEKRIHYIARFAKGNDSIIVHRENGAVKKQCAINSSFATANYRMSHPETLKNIEEIYVSFECNGEVSFSCGDDLPCNVMLRSSGGLKTARILPKIRNCEGIKLNFSSGSPFSVSGFVIGYKNTPPIRWAAT